MIYQKKDTGVSLTKMAYTGYHRGADRYKRAGVNFIKTVTLEMKMCEMNQKDVTVLTVLGDMLGVPVSYNFNGPNEQDTISIEVCAAEAVREVKV